MPHRFGLAGDHNEPAHERLTQQLRNRATEARAKAGKVMQDAEATAKALMDQARERSRTLLTEAAELEARAAALEAGGDK